jgi:hypothetical protein
MKTLIIHPKDSSTDFLSVIYKDKDWTVINTNVSTKILKEQIKAHDRIVMLGHGTGSGLLGFNNFVIDSSFVYLLREKNCVYIWCNADIFVTKYHLKGFYTGMIISEDIEAFFCCVPVMNLCEVDDSNTSFALAIKNSIDDVNMLETAIKLYTGNSNIVLYNRNNLYYK